MAGQARQRGRRSWGRQRAVLWLDGCQAGRCRLRRGSPRRPPRQTSLSNRACTNAPALPPPLRLTGIFSSPAHQSQSLQEGSSWQGANVSRHAPAAQQQASESEARAPPDRRSAAEAGHHPAPGWAATAPRCPPGCSPPASLPSRCLGALMPADKGRASGVQGRGRGGGRGRDAGRGGGRPAASGAPSAPHRAPGAPGLPEEGPGRACGAPLAPHSLGEGGDIGLGHAWGAGRCLARSPGSHRERSAACTATERRAVRCWVWRAPAKRAEPTAKLQADAIVPALLLGDEGGKSAGSECSGDDAGSQFRLDPLAHPVSCSAAWPREAPAPAFPCFGASRSLQGSASKGTRNPPSTRARRPAPSVCRPQLLSSTPP